MVNDTPTFKKPSPLTVAMKLIIFDLDQTLVDVLPIHDKAIEKAFKTVYKTSARFSEIDFAGKEVRKAIEELAKLHKIKPRDISEKNIKEVIKRYQAAFKAKVPKDLSKFILPGIKPFLKELKGNFIAVMTGSAHHIPELILKNAGLNQLIDMTICGTEARTKEEMVGKIIAEANKKTGKHFNGKEIFVIGDSTRDIAAGKLYGAITVAVHTGPHKREQLKKAKPDLYLDDLREHQKLLKIINLLESVRKKVTHGA